MSKIIHIDDSRFALLRVKTAFEPTGHDVFSAHTWFECREFMEDGIPELFVVDVELPGFRSGSELAFTLKHRYPDSIVVLYSSQPMDVLLRWKKEARSDAIVVKERSMGGLVSTVCGYLPDAKEIARQEADAAKEVMIDAEKLRRKQLKTEAAEKKRLQKEAQRAKVKAKRAAKATQAKQ